MFQIRHNDVLLYLVSAENETADKLVDLCRVRNPGPLEWKAPRRLSFTINLQYPRSNAAHAFSPVLLDVARPTALCRALVCVCVCHCFTLCNNCVMAGGHHCVIVKLVASFPAE
jgi:hypothetical protein